MAQGSIGYLAWLLQREKDALAIPTAVVERECHSSVVAEPSWFPMKMSPMMNMSHML